MKETMETAVVQEEAPEVSKEEIATETDDNKSLEPEHVLGRITAAQLVEQVGGDGDQSATTDPLYQFRQCRAQRGLDRLSWGRGQQGFLENGGRGRG